MMQSTMPETGILSSILASIKRTPESLRENCSPFENKTYFVGMRRVLEDAFEQKETLQPMDFGSDILVLGSH